MVAHRSTQEKFLRKVMENIEYNRNCNYDNTVYRSTGEDITVECLLHGEFDVNAGEHLRPGKRSKGCPNCGKIRMLSKERRMGTTHKDYIKECIEKHGDIYDYTDTEFRGYRYPITVRCKRHNINFDVLAYDHTTEGYLRGCPLCKGIKIMPKEEYIKKCVGLYGDKYDYTNIDYSGGNGSITVYCKIHNKNFTILAASHIHITQYKACQDCIPKQKSKGEIYIETLLTNIDVDFNFQERMGDTLQRFDFYLPDSDLYIEFNGAQHYKPVKFYGGVASFCEDVFRDIKKINWCLDNKKILLIFTNTEVKNYEHYFKYDFRDNPEKVGAARKYLKHRMYQMIYKHCSKIYDYLENNDEENEEITDFPYDKLDELYLRAQNYIRNHRTIKFTKNIGDGIPDFSNSEIKSL
jgi:hypothetical protein